MTNEKRVELITNCLTKAFKPTHLTVIDESHKHVGHKGAQSGLGHFKLCIAADNFTGKSELQIHRLIYNALGSLMTTDIHALSIDILNTS